MDYRQMRVHAKWRLPPNEIRLGVVFQQKWIRMRQSTVGIMRMAGRGNVIVFYLCHGTDLIFFTNTVVAYTNNLVQIINGFHKFTLLLGRSEDTLTSESRRLSRLLNLLSSVDWSRTFFNSLSNLLFHCWTVWDGVDGKDSKKLKKYDVEME